LKNNITILGNVFFDTEGEKGSPNRATIRLSNQIYQKISTLKMLGCCFIITSSMVLTELAKKAH